MVDFPYSDLNAHVPKSSGGLTSSNSENNQLNISQGPLLLEKSESEISIMSSASSYLAGENYILLNPLKKSDTGSVKSLSVDEIYRTLEEIQFNLIEKYGVSEEVAFEYLLRCNWTALLIIDI